MWRARDLTVAALRFGCLVLGSALFSGCGLYGCEAPGSTISDYIGQLGQSSARAGAGEADTGVVTITLHEFHDPGSIDHARITVARPGIRSFDDEWHVHDRQTGAILLSATFGYYGSDSLIFRSPAEKGVGEGWDRFKNVVDGGQSYFELHAATGVDTAGIRLLNRRDEPGRCT